MAQKTIQLFICHSSRDEDIVKRLVDIIVKAFRLPASTIRCTSLHGYMLPVGAKISQLREEVLTTKAFVAVMTPNTLTSTYAMFELGCRWGTDKSLLSVVCADEKAMTINEPLKSLQYARANDVPSIHNFISSLGSVLGKKSQYPALFIKDVEDLAEFIKKKSFPLIL